MALPGRAETPRAGSSRGLHLRGGGTDETNKKDSGHRGGLLQRKSKDAPNPVSKPRAFEVVGADWGFRGGIIEGTTVRGRLRVNLKRVIFQHLGKKAGGGEGAYWVPGTVISHHLFATKGEDPHLNICNPGVRKMGSSRPWYGAERAIFGNAASSKGGDGSTGSQGFFWIGPSDGKTAPA